MIGRQPARFWRDPETACAAVFAVLLVLYAVDCLLNAMLNPIFLIAAGGVVALPAIPRTAQRRRAMVPGPRLPGQAPPAGGRPLGAPIG